MVVGAAAAVVLILILGIVAFQALRGDARTAPPASPGPTTRDPFADFLQGAPPTPEQVQGVWRVDGGDVLLRLTPPDLASFDKTGRLFENPGVQGRFAIDGDRITITIDGGPSGCGGEDFAVRASLPERGSMRWVFVRPGASSCAARQNETWVLEQVLPAGPAWADFVASREADWKPLRDRTILYGSWSAEGGGHVLELARNGRYYVAAGSGEQVDYGDWSLSGSRLRLRSLPDSVGCSASAELVLADVESVDPGTAVIRSTVRRNDCGGPWADAVWIHIPDES